MATKTLILLQSMSGMDFSLIPGRLVEFDAAEADRMIQAGCARELEDGEPTKSQKADKFSMVEATERANAAAARDDKYKSAKPTKPDVTLTETADTDADDAAPKAKAKPRRR